MIRKARKGDPDSFVRLMESNKNAMRRTKNFQYGPAGVRAGRKKLNTAYQQIYRQAKERRVTG